MSHSNALLCLLFLLSCGTFTCFGFSSYLPSRPTEVESVGLDFPHPASLVNCVLYLFLNSLSVYLTMLSCMSPSSFFFLSCFLLPCLQISIPCYFFLFLILFHSTVVPSLVGLVSVPRSLVLGNFQLLRLSSSNGQWSQLIISFECCVICPEDQELQGETGRGEA